MRSWEPKIGKKKKTSTGFVKKCPKNRRTAAQATLLFFKVTTPKEISAVKKNVILPLSKCGKSGPNIILVAKNSRVDF